MVSEVRMRQIYRLTSANLIKAQVHPNPDPNPNPTDNPQRLGKIPISYSYGA